MSAVRARAARVSSLLVGDHDHVVHHVEHFKPALLLDDLDRLLDARSDHVAVVVPARGHHVPRAIALGVLKSADPASLLDAAHWGFLSGVLRELSYDS